MNLNDYRTDDKENWIEKFCCGCGTCEQICPRDAISMSISKTGFYKPVIDEEKCVQCGKCIQKCQLLSEANIIKTKKEPDVFVAANKNMEEIKKSSSGGLAFVLTKHILEQQGVVFGAVYNDSMEVVHCMIDCVQEIWRLQGSKYVQSRIGETYRQAETCLKEGRKVLFTGTPCQIGGLYHFLGKDYSNLYTIDIICYGAASPGIFKNYITWKENKTKGRIKHINFRSKLDRWGVSVTEIEYENRKKLIRYSDEDEWYQTFISHVATNEACHSCKYTNIQRKSDITLGDFWGIEKFRPDLERKHGLSKVLLNTDKGKELFEEIEDKIFKEDMKLETAIRPNLKTPPLKSERREKFFDDYDSFGFYVAYKNHVKKKVSFMRRVKRYIKIRIRIWTGR